jgi:hypothetical protein
MRGGERCSTLAGMEREVDVAQRLAELGGISTRAGLIAATSRADVDAALRGGVIVADSPGRYALPATDDGGERLRCPGC